MNCKEAINYIHSLERFGMKPGLERISALCEKLGNPQNNLKFIHVAGTNGKGSTCTMIAEILQAAGYSVGLYTSPYVIEFRERIKYNGEMIEPEELAICVEKAKKVAEEFCIDATEFELITAVAFLYFKRKKCDFVVLEVGLGGRFDATNVISAPETSVIACISKDHTAVLGNTITEIAGEKCGIIKPHSKVVSYPLQCEDAFKVIEETCKNKNSKLILPNISDLTVLNRNIKGTDVKYRELTYHLNLAGEHIVYNSVTAIEAVKSLDANVSNESIVNGLNNTIMPARMELISEKPLIILDGGHNEDCGKALKKFINDFLNDKKIVMVSSMMADKDYKSYLSLVAPFASLFISTKANVPRALGSDELKIAAEEFCENCKSIEDPCKAVECAIKEANSNDAIVVCGSFYLAGEVREKLIEGSN
jgi:dihydrofolate synthase / folylpolyglutamate synthase